jgi:hypothetical protein
VLPVRIDPTGRTGPTRGQAKRSKWRQTTRGFYVPSWVDPTVPEQRILEQSMRLPPGGAVTGWGSCRMQRAGFFDGLLRDGVTPAPVPLCIGAVGQIRETPGNLVSRARLLDDEIVRIAGIPCTRPLRALFDQMRTAKGVRAAAADMDMMAAAGLASISQMRRYVEAHPAWDGVPQVRAGLDLADEDSRSPSETRMRLIWVVDAHLPKPLVNQPVWNLRGRLLGYADLFDPRAGLVGEYDGADHRQARRHSRDVAREDGFRRHGLEYFKVTGPDLPRTDVVVRRMLETRARARWLAPRDRSWTLQAPAGWAPTPTLDEQLELRAMLHGFPDGWQDLPPAAPAA